MSIATKVRFDYKYTPIDKIAVGMSDKDGKARPTSIIIDDEEHIPTDRFFTSLFARFGFSRTIFKYFSTTEVFDRIAKCEPGAERVRVCIERNKATGNSRVLAVTNPTRPVVSFDDLIDKIGEYGGDQVTYSDGIIESLHTPRVSSPLEISGDAHSNRFMLNCPVDGYGQPSVYLAMIRIVCSNKMVALAKSFRSSIALGKGNEDVSFALTRVLDGFNSDQGYAALRQRLESATQSWCSVNEANSLYKLLACLHNTGKIVGIGNDGGKEIASPTIRKSLTKYMADYSGEDNSSGGRLMTAFHGMTGDTTKLYGLANLDSLSTKRQRTLPVNCTVYDVINFATEVATHHATTDAARDINGWVGTLLCNEYDMEGTKTKLDNFRDFHLGAKAMNQLTGSN